MCRCSPSKSKGATDAACLQHLHIYRHLKRLRSPWGSLLERGRVSDTATLLPGPWLWKNQAHETTMAVGQTVWLRQFWWVTMNRRNRPASDPGSDVRGSDLCHTGYEKDPGPSGGRGREAGDALHDWPEPGQFKQFLKS